MTEAALDRSRTRTGFALLLIAAAAIALQLGTTRPFASASTEPPARTMLSPIGLAVHPSGNGRPTLECRWWPRVGDATLCATTPGREATMASVRRGYPLAVGAMWTAILALFLNALRIPRRVPWIGPLATAASSGLAAAAVWSISRAGEALAALASSSLSYAHSGFVALAGAAIMTAVATGLLVAKTGQDHR